MIEPSPCSRCGRTPSLTSTSLVSTEWFYQCPGCHRVGPVSALPECARKRWNDRQHTIERAYISNPPRQT